MHLVPPYSLRGSNELKDQRTASAGDTFVCPQCGETHTLEATTDEYTGMRTDDLLMFYRCKDKEFVGAVGGHLIIGMRGR